MDAITPPKPQVLVEAQPFIPYVKEENFGLNFQNLPLPT